jgi:hypothetical protein
MPAPVNTVSTGLLACVLLHLTFQPMLLLTKLGIFVILFFGVSQLVYVIPAIVLAATMKKHEFLKGLLIGAGISFLLNALCTAGVFLFIATGGRIAG